MGDTSKVQYYENSEDGEMKAFGKNSESELTLAAKATFLQTN